MKVENLQSFACDLVRHYSSSIKSVRNRLFGLSQSGMGSDQWRTRVLFANILMARSKEGNTLAAADKIFGLYPSANDMREANPQILYSILVDNKVNHPEKKVPHLIRAARKLVLEYNGLVPNKKEDLLQFPGVDRYIANVVLSIAFGQDEFGIDPSARRILIRLGFATEDMSDSEIEDIIKESVSADILGDFSRALVELGDDYCCLDAQCQECLLKVKCPALAVQLNQMKIQVQDPIQRELQI